MKDIKNILAVSPSIKPAAAFIATQVGDSVDLKGFASAMAVFAAGVADTVTGDETYIPGFEDSSDDSTFAAVVAAEIEGDITTILQDTVRKIGYKGNKRYLKATLTIAGTTPSILCSGVIVAGNPEVAPTA